MLNLSKEIHCLKTQALANHFSVEKTSLTENIPQASLCVSQSLLAEMKKVPRYPLKRIAAETNISYLTIYRIYRGLIKNPRALTFQKIFELYCKICQ